MTPTAPAACGGVSPDRTGPGHDTRNQRADQKGGVMAERSDLILLCDRILDRLNATEQNDEETA